MFQMCEVKKVYTAFTLTCSQYIWPLIAAVKKYLCFSYLQFFFQRYTPHFPVEACKHYPVANCEHLNEMFQGQETSENRSRKREIISATVEWEIYLLTNDGHVCTVWEDKIHTSVFYIHIFLACSVVEQLLIGNWIEKRASAWMQFFSYIKFIEVEFLASIVL